MTSLSHLLSSDNIQAWLRHVTAEPLLTSDEQITLAETIAAGRHAKEQLDITKSPGERRRLAKVIRAGEEARERYIMANIRLVVRLAKRYEPSGLPLIDLVQQGIVGLMTAVDRFDPSLNNKFSTYAIWWIRVEMQSLLAGAGAAHLPDMAARYGRDILTFRNHGEDLFGSRQPTTEELAGLVGITPERVRQIEAAMMPAVGETDLSPNEASSIDNRSFFDRYTDDTVSVDVERHQRQQAVTALLGLLDDTEATAVSLRFGIEDGETRTFVQVADQLHISKEEAKELIRSARQKMQMFPLTDEERCIVRLRNGWNTAGVKACRRDTAKAMRMPLHQADTIYNRATEKMASIPALIA